MSPWELIEGVKTTSGLPLSLYGGARVERKPLKYEEQFQLIQVHSHSRHLPSHNFVYIANQKDLPTANTSADISSDATRQDGEQGQTEATNNVTAEQNNSQDQKPQNNLKMVPVQRPDQMMAQRMMPPTIGPSGVQLPIQQTQQQRAAVVGMTGGAGNHYSRPPLPQQAYNQQQPQQPSMYQMKQQIPPPYHPQGNDNMWRANNAGAVGNNIYETTKKRDLLKQIQLEQLKHERQQLQMGIPQPPQQSAPQSRPGMQYAAGGMAVQQQQQRVMTGNMAQRNMQDYLSQFAPDQREIVYRRETLMKRMQQQQQPMMRQQQQQAMSMGRAVRSGFVRQAGYPVGAMTQMQQRQRMMQGAVAQARQQQLMQLRQQQFQQQQQQQQQQFGGAGGYGQFN